MATFNKKVLSLLNELFVDDGVDSLIDNTGLTYYHYDNKGGKTINTPTEIECAFFNENSFNNSNSNHWLNQYLSDLDIYAEYKYSYGGEDMGRECYAIYRFYNKEDDQCFIKFDGWYASYVGSELTDIYEVTPRTHTVIKYERV